MSEINLLYIAVNMDPGDMKQVKPNEWLTIQPKCQLLSKIWETEQCLVVGVIKSWFLCLMSLLNALFIKWNIL